MPDDGLDPLSIFSPDPAPPEPDQPDATPAERDDGLDPLSIFSAPKARPAPKPPGLSDNAGLDPLSIFQPAQPQQPAPAQPRQPTMTQEQHRAAIQAEAERGRTAALSAHRYGLAENVLSSVKHFPQYIPLPGAGVASGAVEGVTGAFEHGLGVAGEVAQKAREGNYLGAFGTAALSPITTAWEGAKAGLAGLGKSSGFAVELAIPNTFKQAMYQLLTPEGRKQPLLDIVRNPIRDIFKADRNQEDAVISGENLARAFGADSESGVFWGGIALDTLSFGPTLFARGPQKKLAGLAKEEAATSVARSLPRLIHETGSLAAALDVPEMTARVERLRKVVGGEKPLAAILETGGTAPKLSERLAKGEAQIFGFGLPFRRGPGISLLDKRAAPVIRAGEAAAAKAKELFGQRISSAAAQVRNFIKSDADVAGLNIFQQGRTGLETAVQTEYLATVDRAAKIMEEHGVTQDLSRKFIHAVMEQAPAKGLRKEYAETLKALRNEATPEQEQGIMLASSVFAALDRRMRVAGNMVGMPIKELGAVPREAFVGALKQHEKALGKTSAARKLVNTTKARLDVMDRQAAAIDEQLAGLRGRASARTAQAEARIQELANTRPNEFVTEGAMPPTATPQGIMAAAHDPREDALIAQLEGGSQLVRKSRASLARKLEKRETRLSDATHVQALAEDEVRLRKQILDKVPGHFPFMFSEDAMNSFAEGTRHDPKLFSEHILNPEKSELAARNWADTEGVPLTVDAVNQKLASGEALIKQFDYKIPQHAKPSLADNLFRFVNEASDAKVRDNGLAIAKALNVDPVEVFASRARFGAMAEGKGAYLTSGREIWGRKAYSFKTAAEKHGWVEADSLGAPMKGYMLPRHIFEGMKKHIRMSLPQEMRAYGGPAAKMWMLMRSWWVRAQLMWPSTIARNAISNEVQLHQWGIGSRTAGDFVAAKPVMLDIPQAMSHSRPADLLENLSKITVDLGPEGKIAADQFVQEALHDGIIGTGLFRIETLGEKAVKQIGKQTRGRMLKNAYGVVEDAFRMKGYQQARRLGMGRDAAGALVDRALYNYTHVGRLGDYARVTGMVPFYGWSKNNIPAQLTLAVTRPGQYYAMLLLRKELAKVGDDPALLPSWLKRRFNVRVSGKSIIALGNVLPMADFLELRMDPVEWLSGQFGPAAETIAALAGRGQYGEADKAWWQHLEQWGERTLIGRPATVFRGVLTKGYEASDEERKFALKIGAPIPPRKFEFGKAAGELVARAVNPLRTYEINTPKAFKSELYDISKQKSTLQKQIDNEMLRGAEADPAAVSKLKEQQARLMLRRAQVKNLQKKYQAVP